MSWSPGFFSAATKSTLSPSLTMPASSWFWSPSSESARSVPLSWARTPTWVRGLKRRVVTCSPSSVGSVATRPASWSALEIAPGTTLLRGTASDVGTAGADGDVLLGNEHRHVVLAALYVPLVARHVEAREEGGHSGEGDRDQDVSSSICHCSLSFEVSRRG